MYQSQAGLLTGLSTQQIMSTNTHTHTHTHKHQVSLQPA